MSEEQNFGATRHLKLDHSTPQEPRRGTGPLDFSVPWVVELRVMGTPHVIHTYLKEHMMIGRSDNTAKTEPDINLDQFDGHKHGVSRRHAEIAALNSRVTLMDLHSANGTFLNGGALIPGKQYRLQHGDQIAFGKLEMQISFVMTPSSYEKNDTDFQDIEIPHIGNGQCVLIVEDDEQFAQIIAGILQDAGFQTVTATTVTKAITLLDSQPLNAILTELMLPDRDGLELINFVRNSATLNRLPIIVATGMTGGYQMNQAIKSGVNVFLTKPVGVDELIRGFSQILVHMSN